MDSIKGFISSNFAKAFLTIFLPFFLIISLVFLVKISSLTNQIEISFLELLKLYAFSIPEIMFYTLPLSFVVAIANLLMKLSQSNELIALYALGLNANSIVKRLLLLGGLFSLLLLVLSFLAIPLSKQYYKSLKATKKSEAKLNIVPGKLGQKFGDYYIYVKEKRGEAFHDIVIYNRTQKDREQFFSSQEGHLNKTHGVTSLELIDGYGYTYTQDRLQQAKYQHLEVYDSTKQKPYNFEEILSYWSQVRTNQKLMSRMLFFISISLIPLLSVYMVASFTMINPRYHANRSFLVISGVVFLFYFIASLMRKFGTIPLLLITSILLTMMGYYLFQRRVARYF